MLKVTLGTVEGVERIIEFEIVKSTYVAQANEYLIAFAAIPGALGEFFSNYDAFTVIGGALSLLDAVTLDNRVLAAEEQDTTTPLAGYRIASVKLFAKL